MVYYTINKEIQETQITIGESGLVGKALLSVLKGFHFKPH